MSSKPRRQQDQNVPQETSRTDTEIATDPATMEVLAKDTGIQTQTITRKARTRDTRLDQRDAIVAAWKAQGNKGLPESVKQEDFRRIGQRRFDECLDGLRKLAHCGNRANYSYSEEQAAKMLAALTNALADVEAAFAPKGVSAHRVEL